MPLVVCKTCSKEFYTKPFHVRNGHGKYCSRACHYKGMQERMPEKCFICERRIFRTKAKIRNSKSGKFLCNKSCQTKWRNSIFSGEKHKNWKSGDGVDYRKILYRADRRELCTLCRIKDKRVLAVHHVDKNRRNNSVGNLVWLCHNCHHEVHYGKTGESKLKMLLTSL